MGLLYAEFFLLQRRVSCSTKNPRSGHYVEIDRSAGKILAHKSSAGLYKGIPVATKKS